MPESVRSRHEIHFLSAEESLSEKCTPGKQQPRNNDDQEERPADQCESYNEFLSVTGVFPDINTVIDYGCQRPDQRTESRSIRTVDQACEIRGKRIQKHVS